MEKRREEVVFNGTRFFRYPGSSDRSARLYFTPTPTDRRKGIQRLHREVWKFNNGPIPEGWHIHHRDKNPLNNDISNLECVPKKEHLSDHSKGKKLSATQADILQAGARRWHKSSEGRKWHAKHGKRIMANRKLITRTCAYCGKQGETKDYQLNRKWFCSNACKSNERRKRGVDNEVRTCKVCGTEYTCNRYSKGRACSPMCSARLRFLPGGDRHGL